MDINTKREFILQWHITHRCNLRCRHCYQNDYAAFTSRQEMESVLEQFDELLSDCGFRGHINITGGEPMLHPELFWLLQQAKRRSFSTAVLTNGTLIGLREARMLKASGVSYVQVSLDGTRKTHDMIRGEGSFEQAAEGIIALRSQGIFTSVSFTAQKNNLRELKKLSEGAIRNSKLFKQLMKADSKLEMNKLLKNSYKNIRIKKQKHKILHM